MTDKTYDEQIKVWAASRYSIPLDTIKEIILENNFKEGYACCGGRDPDCYCSFAESASMDLEVYLVKQGEDRRSKARIDSIDMKYGDMGKLIQDIFEAEVPSG